MRHECTRIAYPFRHLLVSCLLAGIAMIMSQGAHAQGTFYPIEGGGGATVQCQPGQGLQLTGKSWGSSPSTVTGCILADNGTYGLSPQPYNVGCKGGRPIAFYPDGHKLKTCTLSNDTSYLVDTAGARPACKADSVAEFRNDGLLISCAGGAVTTGGNKPPQQPGGGTTTGGQPLEPPSGPYATIVTQGETAILAGAGQYTKIGASSNRPGGRGGYLYLGDGRASATYTVQASAAGKYALWVRFDDDGKHAAGARGVEISVNGALALRWNNESRDTKGWVNISVGTVDLRAGANTIVFTKAATTSAAFVLDEFVLSSQPGYVPQ